MQLYTFEQLFALLQTTAIWKLVQNVVERWLKNKKQTKNRKKKSVKI